MPKQKPEYNPTTPTIAGLEYEPAHLVTMPASELDQLRRIAINVVRTCDLIKYGRDDVTIPERNR